MKRLEKGLTVSHKGYVSLRLTVKGRLICESFGKDSAEAREVALARLHELKSQVLRGTHDFPIFAPEKTFQEVAELYFSLWSAERKPTGEFEHTESSKVTCRSLLDVHLIPYFGKMPFSQIIRKDVEAWRNMPRTSSSATINRAQAILSSIFNHVADWIEYQQIEPIKQPKKNPCEGVEKSAEKVRTRILSREEIAKLISTFRELNDNDGAEIIKLALKSVLSLKDLKKLEGGGLVDLDRAKTSVHVQIPLVVLKNLNWHNWRKRFEKAREKSGIQGICFRDLRKTGINLLVGKVDMTLISQYAGHASIKTTEKNYVLKEMTKMKPVADLLSQVVDEICL